MKSAVVMAVLLVSVMASPATTQEPVWDANKVVLEARALGPGDPA